MTRRMSQMGTVVTLIALNLLLTSTIAEQGSRWKTSKILAKYDVGSYEPLIHSPDILDDHKFAAFNILVNSSKELTGLSVKVIGPNDTKQECILPIIAVPLDIRRLSNKTVLLAVMDRNNQGPVTLALVDTNNCNYTYNIYNGTLPLNLHLDTIFTNSKNISDERFSLIAGGEEYCRGHQWCRLSFDPWFYKFQPLEFGVNFTWSPFDEKVKPATLSFHENRFVVRFNDLKTNTHHMRLYDMSNDQIRPPYKELLTIPNYISDGMISGKFDPYYQGSVLYDVEISDWLSYCWHKHFEREYDRNSLHCTRFREDGSVLFNESIFWPEPTNVFRVVTIPKGMVVFTGKASDCDPIFNPCYPVYVAVITRELECISARFHRNDTCKFGEERDIINVRSARYDFGSKLSHIKSELKVRVNESDNSIHVEYVCPKEKRISLNAFTMTWNKTDKVLAYASHFQKLTQLYFDLY